VSTKWISWYECSDVRWQWIPCMRVDAVDRPQRMTSALVEDGFSGRQSHLSRMRAVEYHRSGHRDLLSSEQPCHGKHHVSEYIACIGYSVYSVSVMYVKSSWQQPARRAASQTVCMNGVLQVYQDSGPVWNSLPDYLRDPTIYIIPWFV